jgi:hypothetical protein
MFAVLPDEIIGLALADLPLRGLTSAYLVSRAWQAIAFPIRTIPYT